MGKKGQNFAVLLFWMVVGLCCQLDSCVCGIFVVVFANTLFSASLFLTINHGC